MIFIWCSTCLTPTSHRFLHSTLTKCTKNSIVGFYFPQLKDDFMQLLKDTPDIDRHSKWGDVKHKVDTDPRYIAVDSSSRRERWFNEYKRNLDVSISNNVNLSLRISRCQRINNFLYLFSVPWSCTYNMSLITRKPVFGVSDQVRLKPACSATEAS